MSAPVHINSDANLDTLLQESEYVFVMYYRDKAETYTRSLLPIWEDLSSEHRSGSITFVIAQKSEVSTSCVDQGIPMDTRMTFAVFQNASRVEILDSGSGLTSTEVESMVQNHTPLCSEQEIRSSSGSESDVEPVRRASEPDVQRTVRCREWHLYRCYDRRCLEPQRKFRTVVRSAQRVRPSIVTPTRTRSLSPAPLGSHVPTRSQSYRYIDSGPVHLSYRGYNGKQYYAKIETRGGSDCKAEPMFMDTSGPMNIQRDLEMS